jgi:hypothetical protein
MCIVSEQTRAQCTNGLDDDCDGVGDCGDPSCTPFAGSVNECCNGADDNGNGLVDEFGCQCDSSADCMLGSACYAEILGVCAPRCDLLGGNAFCERIAPGLICARDGTCSFP